MSVPNYDDYISIAEAAELYKTTRNFWYDSIRAGGIKGFELPGRRGTFMLRTDVAKLMQPKPRTFQTKDETA